MTPSEYSDLTVALIGRDTRAVGIQCGGHVVITQVADICKSREYMSLPDLSLFPPELQEVEFYCLRY